LGNNVFLSYSKQNEYVDDVRQIPVSKFEVDTFETTIDGVKRSLQIPALKYRFKRFLTENKIDIVYCPMWHPWNAAMISTLRDTETPYVLTVHDAVRHEGDAGRLQRWIEGYEQRHADAFIALSRHVQDQLDSRHHRPPFGTTLIPLPNFSYATHNIDSRNESNSLRCLFIGRIRPYKGIEILLDAFDQVFHESQTDVKLTLAGSGDLGPYESKLSRLSQIDIRNQWLSDGQFGDLIHSHDVLVLPYLEASQSGVIAAAHGAGKPVVAFAVGGISEQISHGVDGLLAADRSAAGLAQEILLLANNQHLLAELQEGAKKRSSGESTWASSAESVVQLCTSILDTG
jgi:glycosyltransferase involved in cell wall biosynthesis